MDDIYQKPYPQELMPWVLSDEYLQRLEQLFVKHGLSEDLRDAYIRFIQSIMKGEIGLSLISQVAQTTLFLNREEARLFARDCIGLLIYPVAILFDEESPLELLEEYGGDTKEYELPKRLEQIQDDIAEIIEDKAWEEKLDQIVEEVDAKASVQDTPSPQPSENPQQQAEQIKALQQKLADQYSATKTTDITQRQRDFEKEYVEDKQTFKKQFYQSINDRDKSGVIAALWVLAEKGKLRHILAEDTTIRDLLSKHLHNKYSDAVATHFDTHADEPVYIAYFLRHLLIDTLKMSDHDAGALAIHLVNEYNRATDENFDMLAYGDIEQQSFVWRDITEENGRLVLSE